MGELAGRVALVTGAGRGIGRAIALALAEAGAAVCVADIDAEAADVVAQEIHASGGRAVATAADVGDLAAHAGLIAAAETLGVPEILVNNAAAGGGEAFADVSVARYDAVFGVSARGTFFLTQALVPFMRQLGRGRIVNISSLIAGRGAPGNPHYAGAKAAMLGFARSWAIELAPAGITVNTVLPALTATRMARAAFSDATLAERAAQIPAGRLGSEGDVAKLVAFLCTDAAEFINGQAISPNGGEFVGAL